MGVVKWQPQQVEGLCRFVGSAGSTPATHTTYTGCFLRRLEARGGSVLDRERMREKRPQVGAFQSAKPPPGKRTRRKCVRFSGGNRKRAWICSRSFLADSRRKAFTASARLSFAGFPMFFNLLP